MPRSVVIGRAIPVRRDLRPWIHSRLQAGPSSACSNALQHED